MSFNLLGTGGIGFCTGTPTTLKQGEVMVSADMGVIYVAPLGGGTPTTIGGGGTLPAGLIVMWSGLLSAIPSGWNLCDGTNGTPDLRDRFVLGAHAGDDPGATGGANTHTHNDHTVTQPTIAWPAGVPTAANESAHTHAAGAISWPAGVPTHSGTAATFTGNALGTHAHELPFQLPSTTSIRQTAVGTFGTGTSRAATATITTTANTTSAAVALSQAVTAGTPAGTVNITNQGTIAWPAGVPTGAATGAGSAHTHTLAWPAGVPTASGAATSAHSTANNIPLYFALAFIMKA